MYRTLPVSRQVASTSSKQAVRVIRRHLATESAPLEVPKKKKGVIQRIFWATTGSIGTFYVGSAFVAYHNQTYYDTFRDNIPLGQSILEYGESYGWDTLTPRDVLNASTGAVTTTYRFVLDAINGTSSPSEPAGNGKPLIEKKPVESKPTTFKVLKKTTEKTEPSPRHGQEKIQQETKQVVQNAETLIKGSVDKALYTTQELVQRAEAAIAGNPYIPLSQDLGPKVNTLATNLSLPPPGSPEDKKSVYSAPLPLGFEPPPGYTQPAPLKNGLTATQAGAVPELSLPLVAPALSTAPEPIISHLAVTIDNLASYLNSDPKAAAKAGDVLESAKNDLSALVERIEVVKEQERSALEAKLDEQTRDYTLKLMELEMEAQDKLDHQEEGYRQLFDQERARFVQAYREKLDHELKVQTELINERLKEEVIAQGIELQRRWIREVKVRVEEERGGRLAKLDELSAGLKRLERIALDNSVYLDENIRIHSLWTAYRALSNAAVTAKERKPFREELRVLRHIAAAKEDPVVSVVLDSLETMDTPDIGVEPFADLTSWFVNEVSPKVSQVALVPDQNAGVLSYIASRALSALRFKRQGLVPGSDVLSTLARAEYYLNEKNLDYAARELNQLNGPAKVLLHDWLEAARRRLEVQQALEVVQTQATLASLLVV